MAERVRDAESDYVATIDGSYRCGEFLNHVETTDDALRELDHDPDVLAWTRHDEPRVDVSEDYHLVDELLAARRRERVDPVSRDAEDVLF